MTGRPLVGLLCALFVEAKHWVRVRWDFNDSSYESAWQLSFVLMILTAFMIWLDESRYTAVLVMMGWLPPILMPLQFVQAYGMRDSVQLTAFSLLARRSRKRSERLGLIHNPVRFNFGNVTFIVTLLASAIAMKADSGFFIPGLLILIAWMLMATGRCRWSTLVPMLVLAGIMGFAGQVGLEALERWVRHGGGMPDNQFNPNFQGTQIGRRGRVLQNPEVVWRLTTEPGDAAPELLRTSTFNNYHGQSWQNQRTKLRDLIGVPLDGELYEVVLDEIELQDLRALPEFSLRGTVDRLFPMPVPGNVAALGGLQDAEIKKNQTGTIQIAPSASVVDVDLRSAHGDGVAVLDGLEVQPARSPVVRVDGVRWVQVVRHAE
ncbi:MAG: hypothetical protein R3242_10090, partial [Akkermansiaceae bacterium]|nr:hypothetical protein [Akkermansiaceae bacterium]